MHGVLVAMFANRCQWAKIAPIMMTNLMIVTYR